MTERLTLSSLDGVAHVGVGFAWTSAACADVGLSTDPSQDVCTIQPATAPLVMTTAQILGCVAAQGTPSAGFNGQGQRVGTCSCLAANLDGVAAITAWGTPQGGGGNFWNTPTNSDGQEVFTWLLPYVAPAAPPPAPSVPSCLAGNTWNPARSRCEPVCDAALVYNPPTNTCLTPLQLLAWAACQGPDATWDNATSTCVRLPGRPEPSFSPVLARLGLEGPPPKEPPMTSPLTLSSLVGVARLGPPSPVGTGHSPAYHAALQLCEAQGGSFDLRTGQCLLPPSTGLQGTGTGAPNNGQCPAGLTVAYGPGGNAICVGGPPSIAVCYAQGQAYNPTLRICLACPAGLAPSPTTGTCSQSATTVLPDTTQPQVEICVPPYLKDIRTGQCILPNAQMQVQVQHGLRGTGTGAPPPSRTTTTVRPGETTAMIAHRTGMSPQELLAYNPHKASRVYPSGPGFYGLVAGEQLIVPGVHLAAGQPDLYTVQPGDTTTIISQKLGVAIPILLEMNRHIGTVVIPGIGRVFNQLVPGEKLWVPISARANAPWWKWTGCPAGQIRNAAGQCVPAPSFAYNGGTPLGVAGVGVGDCSGGYSDTCDPGYNWVWDGLSSACQPCPGNPVSCGPNQIMDPNSGSCLTQNPSGGSTGGAGSSYTASTCQATNVSQCASGMGTLSGSSDANGNACVTCTPLGSVTNTGGGGNSTPGPVISQPALSCPAGQTVVNGACSGGAPVTKTCPAGQTLQASGVCQGAATTSNTTKYVVAAALAALGIGAAVYVDKHKGKGKKAAEHHRA